MAALLSTAPRNARDLSSPPFTSECTECREASRAQPRRVNREVGRREGGREDPSLLARRSGRWVREESSCCWMGERVGEEEQLSLQRSEVRVEIWTRDSSSRASQRALLTLQQRDSVILW
jgi:hypothetical protein